VIVALPRFLLISIILLDGLLLLWFLDLKAMTQMSYSNDITSYSVQPSYLFGLSRLLRG
jgi:hypothetical protein